MREIDYGRLRSLPARRLIRALFDDGFTLNRQKGSHHRYRHADGRRVSVAFTRRGDTIPIGTLQFIIEEQARWNAGDLHRLGLL